LRYECNLFIEGGPKHRNNAWKIKASDISERKKIVLRET
jgi:hypothetical protein